MPEIANYYWFMTASEILKMFGALSGIEKSELNKRIDQTLKLVGLFEEKNKLVKTFSKGMQVRLNIAQAILHDPEFLILDEPFSGLDPLGRIDVRNILKKKAEEGKTIFLSSHELSEAELICDSICIMRRGAILRKGPIKKLLDEKGEHSLENYFIKIIMG
jgi:ABC-2 type transport system ATP-binding protein